MKHLAIVMHIGWWLAERQVKAGGLNGRPEKLPDVKQYYLCS